MRRVSRQARSESPCLVRGDTEEAAEDGLGAGLLIGKQSRVRPLERCEGRNILRIKVVPRIYSPLGFPGASFLFRR